MLPKSSPAPKPKPRTQPRPISTNAITTVVVLLWDFAFLFSVLYIIIPGINNAIPTSKNSTRERRNPRLAPNPNLKALVIGPFAFFAILYFTGRKQCRQDRLMLLLVRSIELTILKVPNAKPSFKGV